MQPIITFGIPLAPRCRVNDWEGAMKNLDTTLYSLDNQSDDRYSVILVRTKDDCIEIKNHRNIRIVDEDTLEEFSIDKDNKTKKAMLYHLGTNAKFFFRLDWDDLMHRDLVKYIYDNRSNDNGFMIMFGYFFNMDKVIPISNFWLHCGSSYAINYSEEECLEGPKAGFHHQRTPNNRMELGKPLSVIPFHSGMYSIHENNLSKEKHERILNGKHWVVITEELKESFGLWQR